MDKKPKKPIKFKVVKPKKEEKPKKKPIKFMVVKKEEKPKPKKKMKFKVVKKKEPSKPKKPDPEKEIKRVAGVTKAQANKMDPAKLFGRLPVELRKKVLNPKETGVKVGRKDVDEDGNELLKFVKYEAVKKYPFIPLPPVVTANEKGGKQFVRILNSIRERQRRKIGHSDTADYRAGRDIFEKMDGKVLVLKNTHQTFDLGAISRYMRKIRKAYKKDGDEVFKFKNMGDQFPSYSGIMDFYKYVDENNNVIKLGMKNIIGKEPIIIDATKIKEEK